MDAPMASPSPLQHGTYYHIYNRGNNREDIFFEERNYRHFMKLYAEYIEPVAETYAYCLLPNHFHFLTRIKDEQTVEQTFRVSETLKVLKPSQQFSNLFNAYAKAINKAYHRTGSLFQHPFGRIAVTSDSHFMMLVTYIHQNPQKYGLVRGFRTWSHSSYKAHLSARSTRLRRDEVLAWFDGPAGFEAAHRADADERLIAPLMPEDFD